MSKKLVKVDEKFGAQDSLEHEQQPEPVMREHRIRRYSNISMKMKTSRGYSY